MEDVTIADNPGLGRYEIFAGAELAGFAEYARTTVGSVEFFHTEVAGSWEGKGIGSRLVSFAMHDMATRRERVLPTCSFVDVWLRRHPELAGLRAE